MTETRCYVGSTPTSQIRQIKTKSKSDFILGTETETKHLSLLETSKPQQNDSSFYLGNIASTYFSASYLLHLLLYLVSSQSLSMHLL